MSAVEYSGAAMPISCGPRRMGRKAAQGKLEAVLVHRLGSLVSRASPCFASVTYS